MKLEQNFAKIEKYKKILNLNLILSKPKISLNKNSNLYFLKWIMDVIKYHISRGLDYENLRIQILITNPA